MICTQKVFSDQYQERFWRSEPCKILQRSVPRQILQWLVLRKIFSDQYLERFFSDQYLPRKIFQRSVPRKILQRSVPRKSLQWPRKILSDQYLPLCAYQLTERVEVEWRYILNRRIFSVFFCAVTVLYSTLLHLPPLRFHCVGGCWDWTEDCCDIGIDTQSLQSLVTVDLTVHFTPCTW